MRRGEVGALNVMNAMVMMVMMMTISMVVFPGGEHWVCKHQHEQGGRESSFHAVNRTMNVICSRDYERAGIKR